MEELYENLYGTNFVVLSNEFLNEYLSDTKPEYLKVFLYYLWKGKTDNISISSASEYLDLDENDIKQALKYWIRKKIIKKDCLSKSKEDANSNLLNFKDKKQEIISKNRKSYSDVESNLLFVAEKLLGKTLSERQINLIAKCYNEYNFDESLIQYLIEYCSNNAKTNAKYMDAVAQSWYEQNVNNIDDAKKLTESITRDKRINAKSKIAKRGFDKEVDYNSLYMDSILGEKFK